jgi:two-component sensor histidine kinase
MSPSYCGTLSGAVLPAFLLAPVLTELRGPDGAGDDIEIDGPAANLSADKALNVTLVLHELGTDAVKYGALSNLTGRIRIAWQSMEVEGKRVLRLSWAENGRPPVTPPARKGFGTTLIEYIVKGGNGSLAFQPDGLVCVLELST